MGGATAQPLLLVDDGPVVFDAANRVLERLGHWRPLVLIPQVDAARAYLCDAFLEDRIPSAIIIRARNQHDPSFSLLAWIRDLPEPMRSTPTLIITDAALGEASGALERWLEKTFTRAFRSRAAARRE